MAVPTMNPNLFGNLFQYGNTTPAAAASTPATLPSTPYNPGNMGGWGSFPSTGGTTPGNPPASTNLNLNGGDLPGWLQTMLGLGGAALSGYGQYAQNQQNVEANRYSTDMQRYLSEINAMFQGYELDQQTKLKLAEYLMQFGNEDRQNILTRLQDDFSRNQAVLQSTQMDPLAQQRSRWRAGMASALAGGFQPASVSAPSGYSLSSGQVPVPTVTSNAWPEQVRSLLTPQALASAEQPFHQAVGAFGGRAPVTDLTKVGYGAVGAAPTASAQGTQQAAQDYRTKLYGDIDTKTAQNRQEILKALQSITGAPRITPTPPVWNPSQSGTGQAGTNQSGSAQTNNSLSSGSGFNPLAPQRVGGAGAGALSGAAMGSVVPGIGTGIGALIGGLMGWLSDENAKDIHGEVSPSTATDVIRSVPVAVWNYKGDSTPHIGPMAQALHKATGLGSPTMIHPADAFGLAMNALKDMDARMTKMERLPFTPHVPKSRR